LEACPELGTPATPARPRVIGRPSAAFRLVNSVGIATSRVFGAESSQPASLLCTLRTPRSPGEWQHSLPACLLDCDRARLTPAGFQQEVSPFHLRFLLFQTFPSAITTSAVSRHFQAHGDIRSELSATSLWLRFARPTLGSLLIVRGRHSLLDRKNRRQVGGSALADLQLERRTGGIQPTGSDRPSRLKG